MTTKRTVGRRTVVAGGVAAATAATVLGRPGNARADGARPTHPWTRSTSANGWPVRASFDDMRVEGTDLSIALHSGATAVVLLHVVRRYHYEIDGLRRGDLAGGTTHRRVTTAPQPNFLSGTAVEIRRGSYPLGVGGGLFAEELTVVRDIVAECDGVVQWGGDLSVPMEGYFAIATRPGSAALGRLAARLSGDDAFDSARGAGAIDAFDPVRLAQSRQFHRRG